MRRDDGVITELAIKTDIAGVTGGGEPQRASIARAIREQWYYAISQGAYDRDGASLITYLEPWAGLEVRASSAVPVATPRSKRKLLIKRNIVAEMNGFAS